MSEKPTTGGQANLQGIHYQLIRSLFHATRILELEPLNRKEDRYRVVLEPIDGGDLRVERVDSVEIEQTKARKQRTWSLSEVINEVLPDLYRAFKEDCRLRPIGEARFVTDGRRGRWKAAENFFRKLGDRELDRRSLDDSRPLEVDAPGISSALSQWGSELTERGLFDHIVRVLNPEGAGPEEERAVWALLAAFRFEQVQGRNLRDEIEARLRSRVALVENAETVLHALLGDLLERSKNGETILPRELLASYGLADVGLEDRLTLVERGREELNRALSRLDYVAQHDVREQRWQDRPRGSPSSAGRPVVFYGESGQGKSWALYARARSLAEQGRLVVLIEAGGTRRATCQRAAAEFCHGIWGIDGEVPLERLHSRLKVADPANASAWLDLLVDGVTSHELAQDLASYDWEARGIRLCFCWTVAGPDQAQQLGSRCDLNEVPAYSTRELHDYLRIRLGERALGAHYSERSVLHRPFLARIFCDLADEGGSLPPENEFRLLAHYWKSFSLRRPLTAAALAELAAEEPAGRAYPWTTRTLRESGFEQPAVLDLLCEGLLRYSSDGRSVEIWHDRLLSWCMAEGWASRVRDGQLAVHELCRRLQELRRSTDRSDRWGRRWLGEAVLDVLWLLLDPRAELVEDVAEILQELRPLPGPEALASVGERAVPVLFTLVQQDPRRRLPWVQVLELIDSPEVAVRAMNLLDAEDLAVRLAGAEILADHPTAEPMDLLWRLRCELERQEPKNLRAIHGVVGKALSACVRHADAWLERAIRSADPSQEPVEALVYLLPRLEHGDRVWEKVQEVVFHKIGPEHERCIAVCLESFRDRSHNEWLEKRKNRDDSVAPAARRALFVLEPGREPDPLADEMGHWLHLGRGWWLLPHLNADAEIAEKFIHDEIERSGDRWETAWSLLSGFENRINPKTLDLLLDALAEKLARELADPGNGEGASLWGPFSFLAKVTGLRLFERLEARQGTPLERDLGEWLRRQGPQDDHFGRPREDRALGILRRIGGKQLTEVVNFRLGEARTSWGLDEAIQLSLLVRDDHTAELLLDISLRDEVEGSEFPLTQRDAIAALAVMDRTDLAVPGLMKWSTKLSRRGVDLFDERRLSDADLEQARAALESSTGDPDPNVVLTVGLGRREEDIGLVQGILETARPGSELARSCLLALYVIDDRSSTTEQAFLEHFGHPVTEYVCALGLLRIRTPRALEALEARLTDLRREPLSSSNIAVLIAVNLLELDQTRSDVAKLLWETLDTDRILFVVLDELSPFAELERTDVDEWLYRLALDEGGHFLEPGAQVGAIRALAARDPIRAFEAAQRLLQLESPNREDAPRLLLEMDSERALPLLQECLQEEGRVPFVMVIGESLHASGHHELPKEWLEAPSPALREGACIAAEAFPWSDDLAQSLRALLYDSDWEVRNAANRALDRLWQARETDGVVDALLEESDPARRWRLLELALEGGYPGLRHSQPWITKLHENLTLAKRYRISDRLEKRRRDLRQELKKRRRGE